MREFQAKLECSMKHSDVPPHSETIKLFALDRTSYGKLRGRDEKCWGDGLQSDAPREWGQQSSALRSPARAEYVQQSNGLVDRRPGHKLGLADDNGTETKVAILAAS